MLHRLYIRNYALIDTLDISFGKGLNILTGETGAGKSIVLGALSLILGQRAENRFLFDEGRKCVIEGFFDVSAYQLADFLKRMTWILSRKPFCGVNLELMANPGPLSMIHRSICKCSKLLVKDSSISIPSMQPCKWPMRIFSSWCWTAWQVNCPCESSFRPCSSNTAVPEPSWKKEGACRTTGRGSRLQAVSF